MQPNPHLQPLAFLIGSWTTTGTHPMFPGKTFHGGWTFEWIESGALLLARTHIVEPEIPDGVAVFGTDDEHPNAGEMLYYDVRAVSRVYHWTLAGDVLTWSRTNDDFSQRMYMTFAADRRTISARGEMSRKNGPWEADLQLSFTRAS